MMVVTDEVAEEFRRTNFPGGAPYSALTAAQTTVWKKQYAHAFAQAVATIQADMKLREERRWNLTHALVVRGGMTVDSAIEMATRTVDQFYKAPPCPAS